MKSLWQSKAQLTELLSKLVEYDSVTGTPGEASFPEYVQYLLNQKNYFSQNPDLLTLHPLKDGRRFLTALVKGKTNKTLVLLSHFDTVEVIDYGELRHLAFRPNELTHMLEEKKEWLPEQVQKELESGDWLFGRGTMDMKAGLAVQMGVLEKAMHNPFDGNLLLLTVPDEEVNSEGMLAAVHALNELKEKHHLEYAACINSEPMFTKYPNDPDYYLYTGSIGKVLPGFLCYGKETHVGEPFSGLNANLMASKISEQLELNDEYCETVEGEVTPPPTSLLQKDLKEEYSVQIPHIAVSLFNVLTMKRPLEELHSMLLDSAKAAAKEIEAHYIKRAKAYSEKVPYKPDPFSVRVMSYEELYIYAVDKAGKQEVERRMANLETESAGESDGRHASIRITAELAGLCKELSPMIVLFYGPPFYPAVSSNDDRMIRHMADYASNLAKQYGISLKRQVYFPGLSDLSFLQLNETDDSLAKLTGSLPVYGKDYILPVREIKELNMPVINIGPVGRDAHQWTERLYLPYSFGQLPGILEKSIEEFFNWKKK
ncbi:M20/M25/M40 family metallo-hydrolase [Bacillus sp. FJAT-42376]|uniref:M20/M25/M40 family metallo-hydrolase n=1 Tax=Bacillus sp. FJAT-42376 TaxID=2014076 RepID=UPI000F511C6F|nr:M20/M25/M40 family metallo-hydrolase [Bacillus sp. FJAT-42376]AZB43462.1 M20/M25/M40 family metallo-hydrolase [Bacillus sp. FJAT-42376]